MKKALLKDSNMAIIKKLGIFFFKIFIKEKFIIYIFIYIYIYFFIEIDYF